VGLLQGLTSAVYGNTSVPHVHFERFLEPSLITFGLEDEDKKVSKLALAIAFLRLWQTKMGIYVACLLYYYMQLLTQPSRQIVV
jgi:hypothetical protein